MKYLVALFVAFLSFNVFASDTTKVNLKKTNEVRRYRLHINPERTVVLKGPVKQHNVVAIMDSMKEMAEISPETIFLIINSPGGSVVDGFELINLIKTLRHTKGIRTYCAIESEAFSMASLIGLYCHKTFAQKYSSIMFHDAAYGVSGLAFLVKKRVEFMDKYLNMLHEDAAKQMGISLDSYKAKTQHEWWMTAEEAAQFGIVDGVLDYLYYTTPPPPEPAPSPFFFGDDGRDINTVDNPLKHSKTDREGLEEK